MPAMTSPLMALRFSGRLMVIQSAAPRFSRMTLLGSVIAMLACWSYPAGLVVRDARHGRAPHHEGHLLPSPRGGLPPPPPRGGGGGGGGGGGVAQRSRRSGSCRKTPYPQPLPATRDA